jgi:hypothetical protein
LAQPENEEPKMSISKIPTNKLDERSAPSGLTNEVCLSCAEVTKHIHGDCIPCIDAQAEPDFDKIAETTWENMDADNPTEKALEQMESLEETSEDFAAWIEFMAQEIDETHLTKMES